MEGAGARQTREPDEASARVESPGFLTPVQESAWTSRTAERREGWDVVQLIGTLPEEVDSERLADAWQRVVDRHPGLRTALRLDGGEPVPAVLRGVAAECDEVDWTERPESDRAALLEKWLQADRARGFDLGRAPLVRLCLFRFSARDNRLVWTYHRMLLDLRSASEMVREVLGPAPDGSAGAVSSGPPSAAGLEPADPARAQEYWREALAGFQTPTPLGIERNPDAISALPRGWGEHTTSIPAETRQALDGLAEREGASLAAILRGTWALLLHRYSGEADVLIGVRAPIEAKASGSESQPLGNRNNTLPVRAGIDESRSVAAWLRGLREQADSARPFEALPLPRIRRVSEVPAGTPLFRALLVLEGAPLNTRLRALGPEWQSRDFQILERTGCSVVVYCHLEPEAALRIVYDRGRIEGDAAARMLGHFARLLAGIAAMPQAPLAALPLMSDAEVAELRSWNDTRADVPRARVTELFASQASQTPERIAAAYGDARWTYRELDDRSNQVARYLQRRGVAPGERVGLLVEPCLEMMAGLLGILKAGAAYVPLDPTYPRERLEFMIADASLSTLLTLQRLLPLVPAPSSTRVCLDSDWPAISAEDSRPPAVSFGGDSDAYVIYTSGSTGKPKGVRVPHSALANLLWSARTIPGLGPDDVLLAVATISFDIAALELFLPLITGARVSLIDRRVVTDARALADAIAEIRPTVMQATPSLWRMLLEAGWPGDPGIRAICGGEALSRDLADRLLSRCASLWNGYGPTEATIYATFSRVEAGRGIVSIGRPVANTTAYVLDPQRRALPVGIPGELALGGAGIARGYWNGPELTARKFIRDPFSEHPNGRLYRTGDIARYLPDGSLEYLGRLDHQVKIRGFRIELAEIELALARHPGVEQGVVVSRDDGQDERRLVAYIQADPQRIPPTEELRSFLTRSLPDFMIPSAFVVVERFPLTPNGKVDRQALPAPGEDRLGMATELATPVHESEHLLVEIWEAVLRVRPIGIHDNFFDLGGDSLLALRLFTRIEKVTGKRLPLATLLRAPTVATLAPLLAGTGEVSWRSLVAIQPAGDRPPLFCVPGVGGNAVGYHALAHHLGTDQPVYGLQARGLDGRTEPFFRVEDMAAHYVREILVVRVTVFRSIIRAEDDAADSHLGWDRIAQGGVDAVNLTLLKAETPLKGTEPHGRATARELRRSIDEAQVVHNRRSPSTA